MVDKRFCMSSYLAFRYVYDDNKEFFDCTKHQLYKLLDDNECIYVETEVDVENAIKDQLKEYKDKKIGILLSGGMDSACLASYMEGADAYTFRYSEGNLFEEDIERAQKYAKEYNLNLHYVDVSWENVLKYLDSIIEKKGSPVHSIEPQICEAANQAKKDGIELMIIGDAADYVFGGMDGLLSKDWKYKEFIDRYIYIKPDDVLVDAYDIEEAFKDYKQGDSIDYISFMHKYTDIESYASYKNAFETVEMDYLDPYERLKMSEKLDLNRIRSGESKYIIRELFRRRYPDIPIPEKKPMPRPVDEYFKEWKGPSRPEFNKNMDINSYSGNQKWLLFCLEYFLNKYEPL